MKLFSDLIRVLRRSSWRLQSLKCYMAVQQEVNLSLGFAASFLGNESK